MPSPQERKEKPVTVQTGSKLEVFFAAFSQATVHALDRACTVAETWKAQPVCQESPPEK